MNDYPGMYERLEKDEIGYRKGKFTFNDTIKSAMLSESN